jgi:lipid-binding SYLF domain-containing protein
MMIPGMRRTRAGLVAALLALGTALSPVPVAAEDRAGAEEVVDRARLTLDEFRRDETFQEWRTTYGKAAAFLIYPAFFKGGFILGGAGGNGVLVAKDERSGRWMGPVFYTIGGGSVGLQAGVQMAEVLVLVASDEGVRRLLSTRPRLGGDMSIVAGPLGAGVGAGNLTADLVSLSKAKGLFAGASLEGSVVAVKERFNHAYYGQPVRPAEILGGAVSNRHADALKKAAAALAAGH